MRLQPALMLQNALGKFQAEPVGTGGRLPANPECAVSISFYCRQQWLDPVLKFGNSSAEVVQQKRHRPRGGRAKGNSLRSAFAFPSERDPSQSIMDTKCGANAVT